MSAIIILCFIALFLYILIQSNDPKNKKEPQTYSTEFVGFVKYFEYPKDDKIKDVDKAIRINVLAGEAPNDIIISAIKAKEYNIHIGKTYLITCVVKKSNFYHKRLDYKVNKGLNENELNEEIKRLGKPNLFNVINIFKNE